MNELNARLLEYLPDPNTVKGGIGGVVDFVQGEAPEIVNEVLRWHFSINLLGFVVGGILISLSLTLPFIFWNKLVKCDAEPAVMVAVIPFIIGLALVCEHLVWLQIWVAPRLFLLEYISNLIT